MSATLSLEPVLLHLFFMERQRGGDLQRKAIASVSTARFNAGMRRCGYLPRNFPCLAILVDEADWKLFRSICHNPTTSYATVSSVNLNLDASFETRAHNFVLPLKDDKKFVSRSTNQSIKFLFIGEKYSYRHGRKRCLQLK